MDLESVRLFVRAAEKLNISEAGRSLGLAPAVASARLAKLERNLGSDLLHRSTRKVSLSTEGAEFLPFARELLAQERAARVALGLETSEVSGTLRFTAPSSFAQIYIAPILPEFLDMYPSLNLDLQLSDSIVGLIEGSFDLALRNSAMVDSSHKARKLADDRRILCASPSYLKRHGAPQDPDDLSTHALIGFQDQSTRKLIAADGTAGVFEPQSADCRLVLNDGISQKAATVAGAGISMNSMWSVHREIREGALVRVLPEFDVDDQSVLWLVYPKSNVLTAKVRVFIDYLVDQIGRTPVWEKHQ
ncbi:transcriptional regulator, LysR family [Ruegeria halocynthiae]|uniref:Transcriptional regulator, LysR family n=1 Tax=Ruegeria halocynthiae TaxID=985054 RepID=A0A1H3G2T7_9RHOB|nr:LysR family transcriptional regulator [Ruegeria halocynthiae]SDX96679.1 transcriptional regulator, LysR family [Ruegeria halocynthiae]